jgi:hypothetical protein
VPIIELEGRVSISRDIGDQARCNQGSRGAGAATGLLALLEKV